ncbi:DUF362 domain-containing protein [Candidatus Uhrbacteria bacterium]|nr:DUF362 domain-containing protein [Candidatus Uhrbacteria bacterium]
MLNNNGTFINEGIMQTTYARGIPKGTSSQKLELYLEQFMLKVLDNFSWLKTGEIVLIKAAVNSPDAYPATTHPSAVEVLAKLIKDRDGIPVLGDQSGVEYIVHSPRGIIRGSTHDCFKQTGLSKASANVIAFEEDNWDDFHLFEHPKAANWPDGFYITPWVAKADHIVSLPRISTHAQGGVTLGAKSWVGILRQDSRMEFHAQGPYNAFIEHYARGSGLHAGNKRNLDFFEMITEIQLAIADKLRGTIFTATKVQTTMGPNQYLFENYGLKLFKAHVAEPETGLLIGSTDPVAADAVAVAFLFDCYKNHTPLHKKLLQKPVTILNGQIHELGSYNVWNNQFVAHGLNLGLGNKFSAGHKLVIDDAQELSDRLIKLTA